MNFKEIEKTIKADGWQFKAAQGSHFQYVHPKTGQVEIIRLSPLFSTKNEKADILLYFPT